MRTSLAPFALVAATSALLATTSGCRNISRFSSRAGDHIAGEVVKGNYVRAGVAEDAKMCLTLDAAHLQDAPGTLSTSDGRFKGTLLRPIPQIWHDPLSTLAFGDGRVQNLVYVATPVAPPEDTQDVMVFMSLMEEGGIEVRLVRGAPHADAGIAAPAPAVVAAQAPPMFGVFTLDRRDGSCAF
jgi:hypothetical protein